MSDFSNFTKIFGHDPEYLFSAPGRTELSGNHTDHQHGRVLAAAVNLDTRAYVALNRENIIRVQSEGYPLCIVSLEETEVVPAEKNTTAALIRGVAAKIKSLGKEIGGFDAYVTSTVLPGSGLSSSAAFEVLIGTVINGLFDCGLTAVEIAQIGQYAENVYFGKPSGLMDQTASSVGGVVTIDFEDNSNPKVIPVDYDLSQCGYSLCIIDSGADHADLTDEYAAIPGELRNVCAVFGKKFLREVPEEDFYARLPEVRTAAGDRGVLRAIHVYEENKRVDRQVTALQKGDMAEFLYYVKESGRSSWMYLQNVIPAGYKEQQALGFALALAEKLLGGRGACRVHGGGFAGTIQAFVPEEMTEEFKAGMEAVLGSGKCHVLSVRNEGGILVEKF